MTREMMRTAVLGWSFTVALLGAVLGQNTSYEPDPHWQAPADAAARGNPLAHKPQAAAGGKKLFLRNCTECHGEES